MKLFLTLLISIMSSVIVHADMLTLSDDNLQGKITEIINHQNTTYAKIATNKETFWLEMPKQKLILGKSYVFYPPYLEKTDYQEKRLKPKFKKLWSTIGIVDNNINHDKYSFKGIRIGSYMNVVADKLRSLGYRLDIEDNKSDIANHLTP